MDEYIAAAGIAALIWRRAPVTQVHSSPDRVPQPPSLAATDVDPAVVKVVEAARAAVLQSPHSAETWGKLGMILTAHEFPSEANACFVQAEQLDPREPRWPYFQGVELSQSDPEKGAAKLERAIELFGNDGQVALSVGVIAPDENRSLEIFSRGGETRLPTLEVFELKSAWEKPR